MTTSLSFRLSAATFVVLTLPLLTAAARCAGQEPKREVDSPGVLPRDDEAQRAAELRASARVLAAEVRAALVVLCDPDDAYDVLKGVRNAIREDSDLSEPCRESLGSHLEGALWCVDSSGAFIKRQQNEWLVVKAEFRASLDRWRSQLERGKRRLGTLLGAE